MKTSVPFLIILFLVAWAVAHSQNTSGSFSPSQRSEMNEFDDSAWIVLHAENFDSTYEAAHDQAFGDDNWLIYQLLNGGAITVANGYAWLNAPDFWNAGLIRSTDVLPPEYKIRTKIGYINYDLTNYEQADYDDPNFNDHNGYYENGMYFLTITNDTCSGNECAEYWWHYHRKMVIDVDNHLNYGGGGETFHPVYMVYMAPEYNSGGNLLRTWTGTAWDSSAWNWNVAYTYAYDTWYYAELEKIDGYLTLRLYDENKNILEETTPVSFDKIFAIENPIEYLYVGEPHTDDYEGDVRIDEITLLVPDTGDYICGDIDGGGTISILDVTFLINFLYRYGPSPDPLESADINGNGAINILDAVYLINFLYKLGPAPLCP